MRWVTPKMLIGRRFTGARALARWLLSRLPRIVSDTALYALVIYGVGCVIPTPLDQAQQPPNYGPVFVTTKVNPPFGPIAHTQSDPFEIDVVVDDPDDADPTTNDDLHARLFFLGTGGALLWDGSDIPLRAPQVPDPTNPTWRYGTFPAAARCFGRTGVQYLYAIVSDRPFKSDQPSTSNGGLTDTNHWELSCM
jgi:hypothetical protein